MYHEPVSWLLATSKRQALSIFAVAAVFGGYSVWRYCQPTIRTASPSEIRALIPADLLTIEPTDLAAESRLAKINIRLQTYDPKWFGRMTATYVPLIDRMQLADQLWTDGRLDEVLNVLNSGPIRLPSPIGKPQIEINQISQFTFDYFTRLRQFTGGTSTAAQLYRQFGDRKLGLHILLTLLKLADASWNLRGTALEYLVVSSVNSASMHAAEEFAFDPGTSAEDCEQILKAIPPAPVVDNYLVDCWRRQFQQEILPRLADPFERLKERSVDDQEDLASKTDLSAVGFRSTYDAIKTTQTVADIFRIQIENAQRPFCRYDPNAQRIQAEAARNLPRPPSMDLTNLQVGKWDAFKFKLATYHTDNYVGRVMIAEDIADQAIVELSDRWRTLRDCTRILLASRIYRSQHGGILPETSNAFLPYLGHWPQDHFTGQPMRYDPAKQVAYSVGANLLDDGGIIEKKGNQTKDEGVSLALASKR